MALVFCTVGCWDSHLSTLRHREAWAVEARAPGSAAEVEAETEPATTTASASVSPSSSSPVVRRVVVAAPAPAARSAPAASGGGGGGGALAAADESDILIVVSKLKKYIRERSQMSTADAVAEALSDHVRAVADEAIRTAAADGRKTVLERDVPRVRRQ
jgi:hypothetical protein